MGFVLTDHTTRALLDLTSDFDPPRDARSPPCRTSSPAEWRFVVSIVVRDEGLPAPLGDEAFLMPSVPHRGHEPRRRRSSTCSGGASRAASPGATLLVAEATFSEGAALPLTRAREAVLAAMQSLAAVHRAALPRRRLAPRRAPAVGLPLGKRKEVDRGALRATRRHARRRAHGGAMARRAARASTASPRSPSAPRWAGRSSSGPSALPALGQEGELLAAWGAARMVTRTDKRRERMRREMWSKIELG